MEKEGRLLKFGNPLINNEQQSRGNRGPYL